MKVTVISKASLRTDQAHANCLRQSALLHSMRYSSLLWINELRYPRHTLSFTDWLIDWLMSISRSISIFMLFPRYLWRFASWDVEHSTLVFALSHQTWLGSPEPNRATRPSTNVFSARHDSRHRPDLGRLSLLFSSKNRQFYQEVAQVLVTHPDINGL
jgi:hypothetical protein